MSNIHRRIIVVFKELYVDLSSLLDFVLPILQLIVVLLVF